MNTTMKLLSGLTVRPLSQPSCESCREPASHEMKSEFVIIEGDPEGVMTKTELLCRPCSLRVISEGGYEIDIQFKASDGSIWWKREDKKEVT